MADKSDARPNHDPWRYAVLVAKFCYHAIHDPGIPKSLSVLIPSLVFQLNADYKTIGFLVSLEFGVLYLACPISNFLSKKINPQLLATIGGVLAGISLMSAFFCQTSFALGISFLFTGLFTSPVRQISSVTLHQHFQDRYGMAETITSMGGQFGGILFPYLTVLCLEAYGMRGALSMLGALALHEAAVGATMTPPQTFTGVKKERIYSKDWEEMETFRSGPDGDETSQISLETRKLQDLNSKDGKNSDNNADKEPSRSPKSFLSIALSVLDWDSLRNEPVFVFLFLPCQFLFEVCYVSWSLFSFSYGVSVGLEKHSAVYLAMAGSLGGFLGRVLLLSILYRNPRLSIHLFAASSGLASILLFMYPLSSSPCYLIACSVVAGSAFYAGYSSYFAALSVQVDKRNFPGAMSYAFLLGGIGITMSGNFTGFMYELFGSFPVIFRILGVFMGIICLVFSLFICFSAKFANKGKESRV